MLPIRRAQYFTGYFQSLDTDSCELIVIDRHRGAHFAQPAILFVSVIALLLIFLVAAFVSVVGQGWPTTGKSAKVLSMANCGMGAAVGIGVIP